MDQATNQSLFNQPIHRINFSNNQFLSLRTMRRKISVFGTRCLLCVPSIFTNNSFSGWTKSLNLCFSYITTHYKIIEYIFCLLWKTKWLRVRAQLQPLTKIPPIKGFIKRSSSRKRLRFFSQSYKNMTIIKIILMSRTYES